MKSAVWLAGLVVLAFVASASDASALTTWLQHGGVMHEMYLARILTLATAVGMAAALAVCVSLVRSVVNAGRWVARRTRS